MPPRKSLLPYEHRSQPLIPTRLFVRRLVNHGLIFALVIGASLAIGIVGYHWTARLSWLDSVLNASMILGGMGQVSELVTPGSKIFASCYALFSGLILLASVGIMIAPIAHRILHRLHLEAASEDDREGRE